MKVLLALIVTTLLMQLSVQAVPEKGSLVEKDRTLSWGFTPDPALPNVLILGDSISIGYTLQVRELLKGKANVYRPTNPAGTRPENCSGSAKGAAKLKRWLSDIDWSVIHFNWGLHDLKHVLEAGKHSKSNDPNSPTLATVEVYSQNLELIVDQLKATDARLVFATTTPVVEGTLNPLREPAAPVSYNTAALKVMTANGIRINDLYAFSEPHLAEWQLPKNVHFNSDGSAALAKQVAAVITEELNLAGVGQLEGDSAEAKKKGPKYLETGGKRELNVVYKQIGKRKLQFDLYYPTNKRSAEAPVVIYTHGGGWAAGSRAGVTKGLFAPLFTQLLEEGFAVATVDYRLFNKSGLVAMRDCVIDSKDAVRYLAKNADDLGLDKDKFYVFGDSAGGQIAQMLLLSPSDMLTGDPELADVDYDIVAGVSWYGPCDFRDMNLFNYDDRPGFKDRFGPRITPQPVTDSEKKERYKEMSPVMYLKQNSRPLLMIQGDADTTIPVKHAYRMQKRARALNAPVDILIVKNAGHNWRRVGADIDPTKEVITERTVAFFRQHGSLYR
ncbi:prolyl oligopeptidase family serine peptidase [Puniceicoccaceae bacterium]|nr:prolyl oligopeptidase family serine peptidase [Puniceicoccaceae bacterium]